MRRAAPRNNTSGKAYSKVARIGRAAIADIYRIGDELLDSRERIEKYARIVKVAKIKE